MGIVVAGLGIDGEAYVLEDASVKAPPAVWGKVVVSCVDRWDADCVVAETNFGGAMVEAVVQAAASKAGVRVRYKEVKASRGKVVRAEPVAALYEQGKVHHVGAFPELEDQLAAITTLGYMGDGSPDRADAMVWAITEFFPRVTLERSGVRRWPAITGSYDPMRIGDPSYVRHIQREAHAAADEWERPAWRNNPTSGIDDFDPFSHR